jgi:hypothetical protein
MRARKRPPVNRRALATTAQYLVRDRCGRSLGRNNARSGGAALKSTVVWTLPPQTPPPRAEFSILRVGYRADGYRSFTRSDPAPEKFFSAPNSLWNGRIVDLAAKLGMGQERLTCTSCRAPLVLMLPPGGKGKRTFQCFACDRPDPLKIDKVIGWLKSELRPPK